MAREPSPWFWAQRGVWCVQLGGERVVLARGRENKDQALAEFYKRMAARGVPVAPAQLTVADVFGAFLVHVEAAVARGERAASTLDGYARYLSSASATFGKTRADLLKPHQVTDWAEAGDPPWNATTRANAITAAKAAMAWAKRGGLIPTDPIADVKKPTRLRRELVLTDEQVEATLALMKGTPFADLVFALWESGCRPGELEALTADRADADRGVWVVGNKTRHKTGKGMRTVYLTPALVELTRRLKAARPDGLLFVNRRGTPWTRNARAKAWGRVRRKLGFEKEATSYAVRHRYAIEGLRSGLDPSELAALMGHSDVNMVNRVYGHWDQQHERLSSAARKVRRGAGPASGGDASPSQGPPSSGGPPTPPGDPPDTPPAPPR